MTVSIFWSQRTPDPEATALNDPWNHKQADEEIFLSTWKEWNAEFPGSWKLMTLTGKSWEGKGYQLRLWFGEPHSMCPDHADSMGRNLAISAYSAHLLRLTRLAVCLLEGHEADRTTESGVTVWRLKPEVG